MAVYVDEIFKTTCTPKWPFYTACHMYADTREELHSVANKIGLKTEWEQHSSAFGGVYHFDLTKKKRKLAIACGAIPVTTKQMGQIMAKAKGE